MKQTAVDKIIKFCEKRINISVSSHIGAYKDIIEFCKEAKEMEKKQIVDAYQKGYLDLIYKPKAYYNETY